MVTSDTKTKAKWPGQLVPAICLALLALSVPATGHAQAAPPPASIQPVPNELEMAKLIWATMVAVDQANLSGNYSVLRDISAPAFQIINDPARLTGAFASIRASRLDLSNTMLLAPTYTAPPTLIQADVFRVEGYFGLRPVAVSFDLYFQWVNGRWRVYGLGIQPQPLATIQPPDPSAPVVPPPAPVERSRRN